MSNSGLRPEEWLLWMVKDEHLADVFWYELARQQVRKIQTRAYAGKQLPQWYVAFLEGRQPIHELFFPSNYHPSEQGSKKKAQEIRRAFRFGYRLLIPEGFPDTPLLSSGRRLLHQHSTPLKKLVEGDFIKLPKLAEETRSLLDEIRRLSVELEERFRIVHPDSKFIRVEAEICFNSPDTELIQGFRQFLGALQSDKVAAKKESRGGSRYRGRKSSGLLPESFFNLEVGYPTPIWRSRETKTLWHVENWQLDVSHEWSTEETIEQFKELLKKRRTQAPEKSTGLFRRVTDLMRSTLKDLGSLRVHEAREGSAEKAADFMERFGEEHGLGEYGFRRKPSQFSRGRKHLDSVETALLF